MEIEKQVCTLEQAKRLKELGVKQESYFMWQESLNDDEYAEQHCIGLYDKESYNYIGIASAFTASEFSDMLPARILYEGDDYFPFIHKGKRGWYVEYQTNKKDVVVNAEGEIDRPKNNLLKTWRDSYNLAEAMAKFVTLLIENKLITL